MNNATKFLAIGGGLLLATALRQRMAYDFSDKTVLITGGSRGLGLVLAREFAKERANIVICARDEVELERARLDLEHRGANVSAIPCDVTNEADVREMMQAVADRFGRLDVLINNAGVIQVGPLEEMTREDFERAMNIHCWAPLNTITHALPLLRQQRAARIVNISSVGGKVSVPHLAPYSVSKFALVGLSSALRVELRRHNIRVTTVCPGLMRTGSPRNADFKGRHRQEYAWFSISDALPLLSVSAEHAAKEILDACRKGQAELVISLPAKLAVVLNALLPGVTTSLLSVANYLLPSPGGIGNRTAKGKESFSSLSPSWITGLNEQAALDNNEVG